MILAEIVNVLEKEKEQGKVDDWSVLEREVGRENFYFVQGFKLESVLSSKRKEFVVKVFRKLGEFLGQAEFVCSEGDSLEVFLEELEKAKFSCNFGVSKFYELPKGGDLEVAEVEGVDSESFYCKRFCESIGTKGVFEFLSEKLKVFETVLRRRETSDVLFKVNYLESLNSRSVVRLVSSTGISKKGVRTGFYLEFVVTAVCKNSLRESEFVVYERVNDLYEFDYELFFEKCVLNCLYSFEAGRCQSFEGEVVLSDSACRDFFVPDLSQNSMVAFGMARLKFLGISNFVKGREVVPFKKEKISCFVNAIMPKNSGSFGFDEFGVSGRRVCLFEEGVFRNFFGSKQFCSYIGEKATGPFGVLEVKGGQVASSGLLVDGGDKIEILSFSSFSPDMVSGNFSAEIRLGILHLSGKKIPFSGGLFVGNVFKLFENCRFSKELMNVPGFYGPRLVKFYEGKIVGN